MKRYCVVCKKRVRNSVAHCCTTSSLIYIDKKGFFRRRISHFTLDGRALTFEQVRELSEQERTRWLEHRDEELRNVLLDKVTSALDLLRSSTTSQKATSTSFLDRYRNIDLAEPLRGLVKLTTTSAALATLERASHTRSWLTTVANRYGTLQYKDMARPHIGSMAVLIPACLTSSLTRTHDVESVLRRMEKFRNEELAADDKDFIALTFEGLKEYIKSNGGALTTHQLDLLTGLDVKVRVECHDMDGYPTDDLVERLPGSYEVIKIASEELARRKRSG